MEVIYERCCGLDVHKRSVVACVLTPEGRQSRSFGTMTGDLQRLGDWLLERGVTHVAMESSGVYWKPVHNLLEDRGLELLVVNAQHIKAVPGRKTDVKDAEWIAELLRHGLLRASHIPDREQRELQELVRYRKSLLRQRTQVVNRLQKILEGANVKLASVASDVVGASGRAMLEAIIAGEDDAEKLAALAKGRLREKRLELEAALQGLVGPHQRFLLAHTLLELDFLDSEIGALSEEVARRLAPVAKTIKQLDGVPGIGQRVAEEVIAELGTDVTRFPSASHLASWAGLCPGNHESAGKRLSGRTRRGNPWLRGALVEAAWAATRKGGTYLAAQYRRLAARRGAKRAIIAVAHTLLVIIYQLLKTGGDYTDLGGNYFDERVREVTVQRTVRRIERLGYRVTVEAVA